MSCPQISPLSRKMLVSSCYRVESLIPAVQAAIQGYSPPPQIWHGSFAISLVDCNNSFFIIKHKYLKNQHM